MKMEGHVVLNAGNFIHVLSVSLENLGKKSRETAPCGESYAVSQPKEMVPSTDESEDEERDHPKALVEDEEGSSSDNEQAVISISSNVNDDCDNLRISLRDQHTSTDKDREWEILIGSVPNSQSDDRTRDKKSLIECHLSYQGYSVKPSVNDCDIKSTDSDCSSISGDTGKIEGFSDYHLPDGSPFLSVCDDFYAADSNDSTICSKSIDGSSTPIREKQPSEISLKPRLYSYLCQDSTIAKSSLDYNAQNGVVNSCSGAESSPPKASSKQAEKEYEFIDEIKEARHEKLSVFRRRRLAEKKYEFSDENSENIPQNYRTFRSTQSRRLILSPSRSPRFRTFNVPFSELSVDLGETSGLFRSVYEKLLSPSSGSASPNDVLRPINQNITSPVLSPRDDKWREDIDKIEKVRNLIWFCCFLNNLNKR